MSEKEMFCFDMIVINLSLIINLKVRGICKHVGE